MEGWGLGDLRMLQVLFGTFFFVHVHGDGEALPEGWVTDAGHDGLRRRLGLVLFPARCRDLFDGWDRRAEDALDGLFMRVDTKWQASRKRFGGLRNAGLISFFPFFLVTWSRNVNVESCFK